MDPSAHAESHGAATCFHSSVLAGYWDKVGFRVIDYLSGNPTPERYHQSELADRKRRCLVADRATRCNITISTRNCSLWVGAGAHHQRAYRRGVSLTLGQVASQYPGISRSSISGGRT